MLAYKFSVYLLADIFEAIRKNLFNEEQLDPINFIS